MPGLGQSPRGWIYRDKFSFKDFTRAYWGKAITTLLNASGNSSSVSEVLAKTMAGVTGGLASTIGIYGGLALVPAVYDFVKELDEADKMRKKLNHELLNNSKLLAEKMNLNLTPVINNIDISSVRTVPKVKDFKLGQDIIVIPGVENNDQIVVEASGKKFNLLFYGQDARPVRFLEVKVDQSSLRSLTQTSSSRNLASYVDELKEFDDEYNVWKIGKEVAYGVTSSSWPGGGPASDFITILRPVNQRLKTVYDIHSFGQNDVIVGSPGYENIFAGDGNDVITPVGIGDTVNGEAGVDTVNYHYEPSPLKILGTATPEKFPLLTVTYKNSQLNDGISSTEIINVEAIYVNEGSHVDLSGLPDPKQHPDASQREYYETMVSTKSNLLASPYDDLVYFGFDPKNKIDLLESYEYDYSGAAHIDGGEGRNVLKIDRNPPWGKFVVQYADQSGNIQLCSGMFGQCDIEANEGVTRQGSLYLVHPKFITDRGGSFRDRIIERQADLVMSFENIDEVQWVTSDGFEDVHHFPYRTEDGEQCRAASCYVLPNTPKPKPSDHFDMDEFFENDYATLNSNSSLFGFDKFDVDHIGKSLVSIVENHEVDWNKIFSASMNQPDNFLGSPANDRYVSGSMSDNLYGFLGDDILDGSHGSDIIFGGRGKDVLIGGHGHDVLFGGKGRDQFVFSSDVGCDQVKDFQLGKDQIAFQIDRENERIGKGKVDFIFHSSAYDNSQMVSLVFPGGSEVALSNLPDLTNLRLRDLITESLIYV